MNEGQGTVVGDVIVGGGAAPAKRKYTKRSAYWDPSVPKGPKAAVKSDARKLLDGFHQRAFREKAKRAKKVIRHKKTSGRVPVMFRQGAWEVKKGNGLWKSKYTRDMNEDQVRKSLALEFPGAEVIRYRIPNGR